MDMGKLAIMNHIIIIIIIIIIMAPIPLGLS